MFHGTPRSIKLIEKLSRRHLINSSDVFVIKGIMFIGEFNFIIVIMLNDTISSTMYNV